MERKLATIEKISAISPIKDADTIEVATIRGWKVVTKINEFKVGDLCVYCEIDSVMPESPSFEFLRPRNFRIRTIRLRKQISQGIAFPLSILESVGIIEPLLFKPKSIPPLLIHTPIKDDDGKFLPTKFTKILEGEDVTDILGVTKYDPPIPACLSGIALGSFPSHSIKTDEERIQNLVENFQNYHDWYTWIATEKLDGSSCTYTIYDDKFGVASRNLRLKEHPDNEKNSFWKFARENDIESKMRKFMKEEGMDGLTIQGELYGSGIQKNPYKIKGQEVRFFRVFDPVKYEFFSFQTTVSIIKKIGLIMVPVIEIDMTLPDTVEELINMADGRSKLYDTDREGIVFVADSLIYPDARPIEDYQGRLSFKVISNKYLLKEK